METTNNSLVFRCNIQYCCLRHTIATRQQPFSLMAKPQSEMPTAHFLNAKGINLNNNVA